MSRTGPGVFLSLCAALITLAYIGPATAGCRDVCSPFKSHTRCDGSRRSGEFPIHGGIDIAMPIGTPLLAVADGVILGSKMGTGIGGILLLIKHPPKTTGQPVPIFSLYKHLREISPLAKGTKVKKGQVVGFSGKSGTKGDHYGPAGFAHLHYEVRRATGGSVSSSIKVDPVDFLNAAGARAVWPCN